MDLLAFAFLFDLKILRTVSRSFFFGFQMTFALFLFISVWRFTDYDDHGLYLIVLIVLMVRFLATTSFRYLY